MNWGLWALLTLGVALGAGCDDDQPVPADMGMGGEGGEGGDGGNGAEGGGEGGMGGQGGAGMDCFGEEDCPTGQRCDIPDGAFSGTCVDGCNDNDDCANGEECNTDINRCETPPCGGDADCPDGYCDMATGMCMDSECSSTRACEGLDADGRSQACNLDTYSCESLFPCCAADGACAVAFDGMCPDGNQQLANALSCEPNPCGTTCATDEECADGEFCNAVDGRCQDGCRLVEGSCPDGQSCDEASRECVEVPCIEPGDCGLAYQFCDEEAQVCTDGCRDDAACPDGEICRDGVCGEGCDPDEVGSCSPGFYCDPPTELCRENCDSHDDCQLGEICNPENNRCEEGDCRDDLGEGGEPNNDIASATVIELGQPDEDGYRLGVADGRVLCGGDVDFFSVTLEQGERMRVRLIFDDEFDLNMRLSGDAVGPDPIVAATAEAPEQVIFPPLGVVNNRSTYFIEVYPGIAEDDGINYRVEVLVAPAEAPCFPDRLENADDEFQTANPSDANGNFEALDLNVCVPGDVDWFTVPMQVNNGLRVEVIANGDEPPMDIALFSQDRLINAGGGGPNYDNVVAEDRAGRVAYIIEIDENTAAFSDEPWFVRVRSTNGNAYPEYEINIRRLGEGEGCQDDGYEVNNDVASGTDLAALPGVGEGGEVPYSEDGIEVPAGGPTPLTVCSFDDDFYCLDLENGDRLEAWAQSDGVAGEVRVRIVDGDGRNAGGAGLLTGEGADPIPAELLGAVEGRYCVVVDGQGAAQGPYRLWVRRVAVADLCEEDPELAEGSNNTPARPTQMVDIGVDQGAPNRRFEYRNGLICGEDEDWYTFPVDQRRSRVCVMMEGFQNDVADLDMELFRDNPAAGGQACNTSRDCDAGNQCIAGRCQAPIDDSTSASDAEQISITKRLIGNNNGDYLVRVYRGEGGDSAYNLLATVTPEEQVCSPDWQERGNPNDNANQALNIGRGQASICDTWLCGEDDEDWYTFTVPAGQDRTVLIEYANQDDGRAFMDVRDVAELNGDPDFGGFRRSAEPQGDHQCINLRGGAEDQVVTLRIFPNLVLDDGDDRLDYTLLIVPTDMSGLEPGDPGALQDHQGECVNLGADSIGSCPFGDPFAESCWPFIELE